MKKVKTKFKQNKKFALNTLLLNFKVLNTEYSRLLTPVYQIVCHVIICMFLCMEIFNCMKKGKNADWKGCFDLQINKLSNIKTAQKKVGKR